MNKGEPPTISRAKKSMRQVKFHLQSPSKVDSMHLGPKLSVILRGKRGTFARINFLLPLNLLAVVNSLVLPWGLIVLFRGSKKRRYHPPEQFFLRLFQQITVKERKEVKEIHLRHFVIFVFRLHQRQVHLLKQPIIAPQVITNLHYGPENFCRLEAA